MLIFGVGSIGGMVAVSVLLSVPLALAARHVLLVERTVRLAAGLLSLGFGAHLAWQVGLIQALVW